MSKEKLEVLRTLRIIPQVGSIVETDQAILAIELELDYEFATWNKGVDRYKNFINGHSAYLRGGRDPLKWSETLRYSNPGPKIWTRPFPGSYTTRNLTGKEFETLQTLSESHVPVQFSIERNGGVEELVPLLFDNLIQTLDGLGIKEIRHDEVPRGMKRREYYQERGGYDKARVALLHPELRDKPLRESLTQSYRDINGTLPPTTGLFDILKDYSAIVYKTVSTQIHPRLFLKQHPSS